MKVNTSIHPKLFLIGSTKVNEDGMKAWLAHLSASDYTFPPNATDAEKLILTGGKRCYMSFKAELNPNLSRVRDDLSAFIDNLLASKHGSVLAHVFYTFGIEDVSRVFTAEWNRHSVGVAISEQSMRFVRPTELRFWMPWSLQGDNKNKTRYQLDAERRREQMLNIFHRAIEQDAENYQELQDLWFVEDKTYTDERTKEYTFSMKKRLTSLFRRILPLGIATGLQWTGNIRAIRHILEMRNNPAAEEEILYIASEMLTIMRTNEPHLFSDFSLIDGYWYPRYSKV